MRGLCSTSARPSAVWVRKVVDAAPGREHWVVASVRIDSIDAVVPELLALGAHVEVLRPDARRVAVHEAAAELARVHAGAPARS